MAHWLTDVLREPVVALAQAAAAAAALGVATRLRSVVRRLDARLEVAEAPPPVKPRRKRSASSSKPPQPTPSLDLSPPANPS